jgi:hypothetical protein
VCPQAGPAAGHGQDGSGATRADAADPLDTPEARAERQNDDLADEDDADSVLCGSEGSGASSEHSVVQPAPAPGAAGRGKGRGRGKGTAGAPAPAPAAAGRGKGRGKGGGANGAAQKKYKWVDIADHTFTPRAPFDGPDKPTLGPEYDHLSIDSPPHEWFKMRDAELCVCSRWCEWVALGTVGARRGCVGARKYVVYCLYDQYSGMCLTVHIRECAVMCVVSCCVWVLVATYLCRACGCLSMNVLFGLTNAKTVTEGALGAGGALPAS